MWQVILPRCRQRFTQYSLYWQLSGLLQEGGVPGSYNKEYGRDTIWPTALIVDAAGIIRYTELSKHISDRPDPELLLGELRKTLKT